MADREHKLKQLAIGADKFDQVLKLIREAHGHIHKSMDKKESKGSVWEGSDLAEVSAEYRDKRRGAR